MPAVGPTRSHACVLGLLFIAGCASSPPVEFYRLQPVQAPREPAVGAVPLQIVRVHLPPTLDRRQIVRQSGAYEVKISDQHRWSAPLDLMIQQTLSEDLAARMQPGQVVMPEQIAPAHTRKLVLEIVNFMPDTAGQVRLEASWSTVVDGEVAARTNEIVRVAARMPTGSYADQVAAMSRAIAELAAHIAGGG